MKLSLDKERCTGHGLCYGTAPNIFSPDEEGYSVLGIQGAVPAELEAAARRAAEACPERAITLMQDS
jgi:ferredoxin